MFFVSCSKNKSLYIQSPQEQNDATYSADLSLEGIYDHLLIKFPQYKDISYTEPSENYIEPSKWLLQTPNAWYINEKEYAKGFKPKKDHIMHSLFYVPTCNIQKDCQGISVCKSVPYTFDGKKLCLTKAHDILEEIYRTIISAKRTVDITTLADPFNGEFIQGAFDGVIKNAIITLGYASIKYDHPVAIRLLAGSAINFRDNKEYLKEISKKLPAGNKLIISIAYMRSCFGQDNCSSDKTQDAAELGFSWNHAKIINADSKVLITGGQNLWGKDYLSSNPVNDTNIKIIGQVANGATAYANALWDYVKSRADRDLDVNHCYTYLNGKISMQCPENFSFNKYIFKPEKNYIKIKAIPIGKLGGGVKIEGDDQSEVARVFALKSAKHTIKISQQAIFSRKTLTRDLLYPIVTKEGNVIQAIAYAIYKNNVDVYIVTSHINANYTYTPNIELKYISRAIRNAMARDYNLSKHEAVKKLKKHLKLGYIGTANDADPEVESHNKFWMVDDRIFYLGSHNFYPAALQEFGVIVEGAAAQILLEDFWNPMWSNSIKKHNALWRDKE